MVLAFLFTSLVISTKSVIVISCGVRWVEVQFPWPSFLHSTTVCCGKLLIMGKKTKVGKQRKDKFYHLAKETGYRSRAAFKLIQLNRKFEFLQKSRVLVDLCAAPGGWMQVAVEHMPVSSVVVGVDLFPIKSIAGCINIQEDITTPRCLQLLKKELKTWKVDCVLHDGAPNVGQNWIYDAYQQTCLTLSAFKLATELLKANGYFITKVFRSKDYNSLLWVLKQFFKNVYSTKPAASRIESAEIFVVCKGYLAPASIDPKFLDAKYVFEDINVAKDGKKQIQTLLSEIGKKKKAEGYPVGETLLYKPINASEFIRSANHIELLDNTSQIIIDEDWIMNNARTTQDIKDYCGDVKVLGKKETKALINWRNALRDKVEQFAKLKKGELKEEDSVTVEQIEEDGEGSDVELQEFDNLTEKLNKEQLKAEKKKRKKLMKDRKKIHDKTNLKMIIPGDVGPTDTSEDTLFNLKAIKSAKGLEKVTETTEMPAVEEEKPFTVEDYEKKRRAKVMKFDKDNEILDSSGNYYKKIDSDGEDSGKGSDDDEDDAHNLSHGLEDSDEEMEFEEVGADDEEDEPPANPLLTDLDNSDKNQKRIRKAQMWFDKDIFDAINDDSDEDTEITAAAEAFTKKGVKIVGFEKPRNGATKSDAVKTKKRKVEGAAKSTSVTAKQMKSEVSEEEYSDTEHNDKAVPQVPVAASKKQKKLKLDAEGLALGSVMIQSKKAKRDLLDEGWNRYAFDDPGLPEWFVEDEKKHMKKAVPVPPQLVEDYQKSLVEINARPIKKVIEAKARKKKRTIRKFEKAKKKAEAILEKGDMTETEKASQLKQLYKKARVTKKKEVTYVVSKKFNSSKRPKRPTGLKGHFKVVDPRMKKDLRKLKQMGGGKGKGKGGGKSAGRGGKRGKKR